MKEQKKYLVIDLKSFYASVECVERKLDPMTTRLVVADPSRTEKTICLAVSPALKKLGVPGRCRLFEIPKRFDFIIAPPRMQLYLDYSTRIYGIYLKYFAPEDIHVYSVDEAFMDVTHYLKLYRKPEREIAQDILDDIHSTLGLFATCGIGANMYLAKIALDIMAKNAPGFIGELDEESFKQKLWHHRPLTDFWMIGRGTAKRLEQIGIYDMYGIAQADERLLYRIFGVNSELLMDHAWGIEPTTIEDIKNYKSKSTSISSGQVLAKDYNYIDCRLIVKEMSDLLCLELVRKHKLTDNISIYLGYSFGSERIPIGASETLHSPFNSNRVLTNAVVSLYDRVAIRDIYYRRVSISFNNLKDEEYEQFSIFAEPEKLKRDRAIQRAAISIKEKYGKSAILKGMNLEEAATTIERNAQIGGHRC